MYDELTVARRLLEGSQEVLLPQDGTPRLSTPSLDPYTAQERSSRQDRAMQAAGGRVPQPKPETMSRSAVSVCACPEVFRAQSPKTPADEGRL